MGRKKNSPGSLHIAEIPSKQQGKTYYGFLLRQSYRDPEDKSKVRKRTLANISCLPKEAIVLLKGFLKGKTFLEADTEKSPLEIINCKACGHVDAVMVAFKKLKVASLISTRSSKERDLICVMIASRILGIDFHLSDFSWYGLNKTTLPDEFPLINAASPEDEDRAMAFLLKRQDHLQKKLAKDFLPQGEGVLGPLGLSQDKKTELSHGLLCDLEGRPVAVISYGSGTFVAEVERLQKKLKLSKVWVVGEWGEAMDEMRGLKEKGIDWLRVWKKVEDGGCMDPSLDSMGKVGHALKDFKTHHPRGDEKAYVFLCMLAYFVEWHMRRAWREFTWTEEKKQKNLQKKELCSYEFLLRSLTSVTKVKYRVRYSSQLKSQTAQDLSSRTFESVEPYNEQQQHIIDLLHKIPSL